MAGGGNRIGRKDALGMQELISQYIREMKLASGFNRQRIFEAWDVVSGAPFLQRWYPILHDQFICSEKPVVFSA